MRLYVNSDGQVVVKCEDGSTYILNEEADRG